MLYEKLGIFKKKKLITKNNITYYYILYTMINSVVDLDMPQN